MKLSNSRLVSVTIGALGLVWCLAVFTVSGHFEPALHYGGGLVCGMIGVVLSVVYLMMFRHSPGPQAAEAGALSVYVTILYAVADIVANTIFILRHHGDFNSFLLLCNVAIGVAYVIVILYVEKDARRLSDQLAHTEQKILGTADISGKLGEILGIAEDSEIRKQILKLKESVDYSTNITTGSSSEKERMMERQLDELMEMIINRSDASAVRNKIRQAEMTWKTRNSAASSRR